MPQTYTRCRHDNIVKITNPQRPTNAVSTEVKFYSISTVMRRTAVLSNDSSRESCSARRSRLRFVG